MLDFTEKENAVIFFVRVVPRAAKSQVAGEFDGALKIRLAAAPVDGEANAELVKTLAKFFGVPKSAVEILKGQTSKTKQIKIAGVNSANLPDIKSA